MTGIADLYLYLKRPNKDRRKRLLAHFQSDDGMTRFVVLSWKRTGSNLLCGILHNHPQIAMHNELFNPIDIFTYHPDILQKDGQGRWTVQTRDLYPVRFLEYIWDPKTVARIDAKSRQVVECQAVGFKSFPEHWMDIRNEDVWQEHIMEDLRVKKVILHRQDELAVYVSMQRADMTGHYMTHSYPEDLKIHIDPADFQGFVNNYRHTFQKKYTSPIAKRDTFWISYEQMVSDDENFKNNVMPKLFRFLGVDAEAQVRPLRETIKQADVDEDLSKVISNYDELEFCFRHTDVLHFANRASGQPEAATLSETPIHMNGETRESDVQTWSILLPICSRPRSSEAKQLQGPKLEEVQGQFNTNRFTSLSVTSQHVYSKEEINMEKHWKMLLDFSRSLKATSSAEQLEKTEVIVGIDVDDVVFQGPAARKRIASMLPCDVIFVDIHPNMYGHVCKIWNYLASKTSNDFVVLLGDDVNLLDPDWQQRIVARFRAIAKKENLPFGAACVALNDLAFPGFPTFPVVHRWHIRNFGALLPKQFANQGGDPYLFELYARFNASELCPSCRMENTIGGDGDARYEKHDINWRGQILNMNLRKLRNHLLNNKQPNGVVLDIVVPSYRVNNNDYLKRIVSLRSTIKVYVKFWIVVDNPDKEHLESVKNMANELNEQQLKEEGNYFINVLHYSENRGASFARNYGYNFSTADWVLFLDDDVIPDQNILDAYAGAIRRYPEGKVFVGLTNLPEACNLWTQMLCACNVGYFYSIAKRVVHPSWGVTANLMVRGSRFNSTIQFKELYPKTGGGEDIDFVYQFKEWYQDSRGRRATVSVPEAIVKHPWWNKSNTCYRQIMGWAWGDSLCITEWSRKTFLACPNWIEFITFVVPAASVYSRKPLAGIVAGAGVFALEHALKGMKFYSDALKQTGGGFLRTCWVALGAGSVLSSQEVTRTAALVYRKSLYSLCRRVDWFDGDQGRIKLNIQLDSIVRFGMDIGLTWMAFKYVPVLTERFSRWA